MCRGPKIGEVFTVSVLDRVSSMTFVQTNRNVVSNIDNEEIRSYRTNNSQKSIDTRTMN